MRVASIEYLHARHCYIPAPTFVTHLTVVIAADVSISTLKDGSIEFQRE